MKKILFTLILCGISTVVNGALTADGANVKLMAQMDDDRIIENGGVSYRGSGNVLSYENYLGEVIVLKNGHSYRDSAPYLEVLKIANVIPLRDVMALTLPKANKDVINQYTQDLSNVNTNHEFTKDMVQNYYILAENSGATTAWKDTYRNDQNKSKWSYLSLNPQTTADYLNELMSNDIEERFEEDFYNDTYGKLTHTEFQVAALLGAYKQAEGKHKEALKRLLPKCLVDEKSEGYIYSLFEACQSCRKVEWLQHNKHKFLAHIVDSQQTGSGKKVLTDFKTQDNIEKYKNK